MFLFDKLHSLHLEISSVCQASCPMCIRNVNGGLINDRYTAKTWTLDNYRKILSKEVIKQIGHLTFCGNLGDPISNDHLLDMIDYTLGIKPYISISIHTNGSLRTTDWWKRLAHSLGDNARVTFALDGLKDTHSKYRIGTYFDKIIENAKSFIDAGGFAEWAFIEFKHNQHQIEEARTLSKELGFKIFQVKNSTRFVGEPRVKVYDKFHKHLYDLEPPDSSDMKFIDRSVLDNYKEIVRCAKIDCIVQKEKSVYIDHNGDVFPCCWIGSVPYTFQNTLDGAHHIRLEMYNQHIDMLGELGDINSLSRSVKEIINDAAWQNIWDVLWNEKKLIVCARTCGSVDFSQPKDQFINRYDL